MMHPLSEIARMLTQEALATQKRIGYKNFMSDSKVDLWAVKLNSVEARAMRTMEKHGFTWVYDSIFKTPTAGKRAINRLVRFGLVEVKAHEPGFQAEYQLSKTGIWFLNTIDRKI